MAHSTDLFQDVPSWLLPLLSLSVAFPAYEEL